MSADMFGRTEEKKAASQAELDKALGVPCPGCGSLAGERCVNTITGEPHNIVHAIRVRAWENGPVSDLWERSQKTGERQ